MDTLQPRADWESLGDKWFRKTQTYTAVFDPDLDLDNYILVGAPFAGAIGTLPIIKADSRLSLQLPRYMDLCYTRPMTSASH